MSKVTFKLERDNRPLVELFDKNTMKSKFFSRQYTLATRLIARHLDEEKHVSSENEFEHYTDNNNNIFAFVGDRGTGKTSCMLSVANSLVNKKENAFEQQVLNDTDFFTIGLLDPSYFDSEHDILMLFVAKLYALFSEIINKVDFHDDSYMLKTRLLKDFSATQKHIHTLLQNAEKIEGDEFERLTSYAVALDLKNDICNLIDNYRKLIDKPNAVMLLMVDDIDLNTSEASKMAELLRKYFIHSHTVILISVKLDQLSYIKKLDLSKEFDKIIGKGIEYQEIDEMAERYLSKFIPQEHRIFLPTPELYFDNELSIEYGRQTKSFCSVKQAVPELIYQKTRYLFYNFKGEKASYIIPRNLRDLRQLLKVLAEMEGDFNKFDPKMAPEMKERNRKVFQNYLFEDWLVNNLDNDSVKLIKHILSTDGASQINNAILQTIKLKFSSCIAYTGIDDIDNLMSFSNYQSFNISIGDIIGVLDMLSNFVVSEADKKFIFFINTILSMKLYEYQAELIIPKKDSNPMVVAPEDYIDNSSNYFKLVGGRLFNTTIMEFLPRRKENTLSRSHRIISRGSVLSLIESINKHPQKDYRALELMMLCTFRTTSSRADGHFRSERRIAYTDFQEGGDFVFEIGSLFNNILNKDFCYDRFANLGGEFKIIVDKIKERRESDNSLYKLLTDEVCEHMSFRSMDLLQYFISYIGNVHYSEIESPFKVFACFLSKVGDFEFKTYKPVADKKNKFMATVKFGDHFKDLFDLKNDEKLQKQFDSLFGDEIDDNVAQSGIAGDI